MRSDQLYKKLAKYYDLIYSDKDYRAEAESIHKLIQQSRKESKSLLDLACGTGNHIQHLKKHYQCTGIDISEMMLSIAAEKNPDCEFISGDMTDTVPGRYDIIISMFSSIAYIKTYENFKRVAMNISNALAEGGIVMIQSWYESGKFTPGIPFIKTIDKDTKLMRMAVAKVEGICSITEYHYLIYENNKIEHVIDKHTMALFDIQTLINILGWNNISAKYIEPSTDNGRGLIIGEKISNKI